ncbi:MAG: hypothetical protein ACO3DP_05170 [Candidatus Nanopelagicaceae bacterium]
MQKRSESQASSIYDLIAHTAEKQEDPVQSSIRSQAQEQERIAEKEMQMYELRKFSDYILNNTNWIKLWNIIHDVLHDPGLSHEGGDNFNRSRGMEQSLSKCIARCIYVNTDYDVNINSYRTELKFIKKLFNSSNTYTNQVTAKNGRPGSKKTEEEQKLLFERWLKSSRFDFIMLIEHSTRRVFVTTESVVKENAVDGSSGIIVKFPIDDIYEIQYQHMMPQFYDSEFKKVKRPLSELMDFAYDTFLDQYD